MEIFGEIKLNMKFRKDVIMSKEEFNKVWKDTSKKGILNQYYYDYCYMQKLKKDINKATEYIEENKLNGNKISEMLCGSEIVKLLEILKGEDNE